jgi:hypothetical protein
MCSSCTTFGIDPASDTYDDGIFHVLERRPEIHNAGSQLELVIGDGVRKKRLPLVSILKEYLCSIDSNILGFSEPTRCLRSAGVSKGYDAESVR